MNFENTYITLKDSDKTKERIKDIAKKYAEVSGFAIESYLNSSEFNHCKWRYLRTFNKYIKINRDLMLIIDSTEITEQHLDDYLAEKNKDITKWACFKEVADVLGEENAEKELKLVLENSLLTEEIIHTSKELSESFEWFNSPQKEEFWTFIHCGELPEEYKEEFLTFIHCGELPEEYKTPKQESFKPKLVASDCVIKEMKETFEDKEPDTIGSLVEKLYQILPQSNVTISVNGTGQILLHGDKMPLVDISNLEFDEITKAYEAMVMLEGCFLEYDGENDED